MVLNNIGNSFDTIGSIWVINDKKELNMKNALVKADSEQTIVDIQFLGSYTNTLKPTIVTVHHETSNITNLNHSNSPTPIEWKYIHLEKRFTFYQ